MISHILGFRPSGKCYYQKDKNGPDGEEGRGKREGKREGGKWWRKRETKRDGKDLLWLGGESGLWENNSEGEKKMEKEKEEEKEE